MSEKRATTLRLAISSSVLAAGYLGLALWSSDHLPSSVAVGHVQIGGMSHPQALAAIDKGAKSVLERPIVVTVPDTDKSFEVVPAKAGFTIDGRRSLEGLTGFTLNPVTVWDRLTGSVEAPLLTRADDEALTAYLTARAKEVAVPAKEGAITFPAGKVEVTPPVAGRALDIAGTKLAVRKAFPDETQAKAAVNAVAPTVTANAVQEAAQQFAARAMSGPVTLKAGKTSTQLAPADYAPAIAMVPDGKGGLVAKFDEAAIADLVAEKVDVATVAAKDATWVFERGRPKLIPSVDGTAVDEAAVAKQVVAAITSDTRTVEIKPVVAKPKFTTEQATKAGIKDLVVDFSSPFPTNDTTRTQNLRVATRTINGTYIPPGGTFSLNGILGERTTAKGYADGTVIINGRLTRGTGGGISQVSTVIYNLAYFAGADTQEFTMHAFFIPRYPEGREATVFWPNVDNKWKNDTPYGMLLQTWVEEDGFVRGRVWSTKTWDIKSVKSERTNIKPPKTIEDGSATCYPQQPQPGFDVTVTRQWYRPGSSTLVKSEAVKTRYIPEDEIVCTNPDAKP
jgi:vancomycin resistance protein YoaR